MREKKPAAPKPQTVAPKQTEVHVTKAVAASPSKSETTATAPKADRAAAVRATKPEPVKPEVRQSVAVVKKEGISKSEPPAKATSKGEEDRQVQPVKYEGATAFIKLADGFDFPVGKPDAKGYYKARGFRSHGHLGEDWDGLGGGDTDLGDPIYCIGDGIVVFARDCKLGWGNVVIVRHVYRDGGAIRNVDSFYGHLQKILVHRGQAVKRGQQIATMGNAHGLYDAHLHLEIRKNIEIGMSRAAFARDFNNYYDPSTFIASHRVLPKSYGSFRVAMDTFKKDEKIRWDKVRRFSGYRGGGDRESALALKRALASQSAGTQ